MSGGFTAIMYDGESSEPVPVDLSVDAGGRATIAQIPGFSAPFADLEIQPRIGNSARHIRLPGGQYLESGDNDEIDRLCELWRPSREGLPHRLEANMKLVFVSLFGLLLLGYGFVVYGIPVLSEKITEQLPVSLDIKMAEHALQQMDQLVFQPTQLSEERRETLQELFSSLTPEDEERVYRLYFRSSDSIGANAFALPDGTIVMTDQLVELATNDTMLASILLHEIGHIKHRHAVQGTVRQAGISAVILLFTGDVGTASSLVLLLPTILLQANYSQEFEWQSDTYALQQMRLRGMDTNAFADIMERMMNQRPESEDTSQESSQERQSGSDGSTDLFDYFSTHPPTAKRIERFRTD